MGKTINDPHGVEGTISTMPGLNILPIETIITPEKLTEQCTFTFGDYPEECTGYQIHMGETLSFSPSPLCVTYTGNKDGYFLNEKTWGTYIHGIFDNPSIMRHILKVSNNKIHNTYFDFAQFKDEQYNKLAELIRNNLDLDLIYKSLVYS